MELIEKSRTYVTEKYQYHIRHRRPSPEGFILSNDWFITTNDICNLSTESILLTNGSFTSTKVGIKQDTIKTFPSIAEAKHYLAGWLNMWEHAFAGKLKSKPEPTTEKFIILTVQSLTQECTSTYEADNIKELVHTIQRTGVQIKTIGGREVVAICNCGQPLFKNSAIWNVQNSPTKQVLCANCYLSNTQ